MALIDQEIYNEELFQHVKNELESNKKKVLFVDEMELDESNEGSQELYILHFTDSEIIEFTGGSFWTAIFPKDSEGVSAAMYDHPRDYINPRYLEFKYIYAAKIRCFKEKKCFSNKDNSLNYEINKGSFMDEINFRGNISNQHFIRLNYSEWIYIYH